MSKFELVDDYLMNRLTESERVAFEQQITSDPSLKGDLELQKNILEGIRKARAAELKAMLNNVPVGSPLSSNFTIMKIAAGIIGAGILITSLYYYYQAEPNEIPNLSTSIQDSVQGNDSVEQSKNLIPIEEPTKEDSQPIVAEPKEQQKKKKKENDTPSAIVQPKIEVVDPTDELTSDNNQEQIEETENSKSALTASHIQVETDSSSKKYNFHYQFNNGKLQLFGPFDKSLYEILEINGESHAVFLFYRENYYLLDEQQNQISKLQLIKDSALLKKLKEYRGR
jgi:hypothetical protein